MGHGVAKQFACQVHRSPQPVIVLVDQRPGGQIARFVHDEGAVEAIPNVSLASQLIEVRRLLGQGHVLEMNDTQAGLRKNQHRAVRARRDIDHAVVHKPAAGRIVVDPALRIYSERPARRPVPILVGNCCGATNVCAGQFRLRFLALCPLFSVLCAAAHGPRVTARQQPAGPGVAQDTFVCQVDELALMDIHILDLHIRERAVLSVRLESAVVDLQEALVGEDEHASVAVGADF